MDHFIIFLILVIFSFIQSIFGVGLLLFGTPTLLIIGYEYYQVLNILLPASITISFLQLKNSKENISKSKKDFNYYCLPILILFTFITLLFKNFINFKLIISAILILSSLYALNKHKINNLKSILLKHSKIIHAVIGFIHGVSNMGGSFLSIYHTTINNNKYISRKNISYAYLLMGSFQYIILLFISYDELNFIFLYFFLFSILIFYIAQKIFIQVPQKKFSKFISFISLIYGIYIFQTILVN